jgi:hypothetical protein
MGRFLLYLGAALVAAVAAFLVVGIIVALPWWGMISGFLAIGIIAVWILSIVDIWRRADLSTATAIIWTGAILIFPLLATMVYFFTRPSGGEVTYKGETVQ